jgi:glycosyltransferase involved in cell wall biosynthesis
MNLSAEQVTIAVTVFSRREFVCDAIRSALNQTIPVKVIVVEDCGPDAGMREFVLKAFGDRVEYFRNPKNRGLFDNWNACLEYCRTPWLSILHDDDLLRPNFVETMLALAQQAPGRALYFGRAALWWNGGRVSPSPPVCWPDGWRELDVVELAVEPFLMFPGQLLRVGSAQTLGGFRKNSYFTGDWDLWFRLALRFGAAQSATEVAVSRHHGGWDRGTSLVMRKGWKFALDNVQRKRNLALLRQETGIAIPFQRANSLIPSRWLFYRVGEISKRMRTYNWWLFTHCQPPHFRYALLQWLARLCGPRFMNIVSCCLHDQ